MENHKHCQNCGNMISPSETFCPICKLAIQTRHDFPIPKTKKEVKAMNALTEAIEKFIREHEKKGEKSIKKAEN